MYSYHPGEVEDYIKRSRRSYTSVNRYNVVVTRLGCVLYRPHAWPAISYSFPFYLLPASSDFPVCSMAYALWFPSFVFVLVHMAVSQLYYSMSVVISQIAPKFLLDNNGSSPTTILWRAKVKFDARGSTHTLAKFS